jgi:hypothetical protein
MTYETERGPRVVFVPPGGNPGQILVKTGADNYDTQWQTAPGGGGGNVNSVNGDPGPDVVLDKTDIGLGNVDNTSDANKPISTATQNALDLKAPLTSPAFAGAPTAPTPSVGDNSARLATTAWVLAELSGTGSTYPEVANYAALPASPATGDTYVVLAASGIAFVNKKEAGMYRWSGSAWVYLGSVPENYFTDNTLRFFDDVDISKQLIFELSDITTGAVRTAVWPDKNGTVAMVSDTGYVTNGTKGDITVSGVLGAIWTIVAKAVSFSKIQDIASGSILYRKTAGVGPIEEQTVATLKTDLGLSGTNTGDQTITLTGDVTGSGTGSFAATIGNGVVTLAKQADVGSGTVFYRKSLSTGSPETQTLGTLKADLGLSGSNTGDQTITLTGDVTGSGTGSFAATVGNNTITLAKMADVATGTVFYRKTASTGDPEVQTLATLKTDLGLTGTNSGDTPITVQDEGSNLTTTLTSLNFTGAGVTASNTGGAVTVTISGGGGGGLSAAEIRRRIFLGM